MPTPFDKTLQNTLRTLRNPSQGVLMSASPGTIVAVVPPAPSIIVDDNNNIRRLWTPGDPWSSDFYFGGGEL